MNNNRKILNQSAQFIKGVGPKKIKILNKLRIFTVKDLLYNFPRRYEDRSNLKPINKISIGNVETVRGRVLTLGTRRLKGGRSIFHLAIGDESGVIYGTWFNQPYLKNVFKINDEVILHGKVDRYRTIQITAPEYEILRPDEEDNTIHTGRIVPIYPLTFDLSQRYVRLIAKRCTDNYLRYVDEFLPPHIIVANKLMPLNEALSNIHFPATDEQLAKAKRRIIFDEFFLLQLALALKKKDIKDTRPGISFACSGRLLKQFRASLPFELTPSQKKVIKEIERDMNGSQPMNRLLQGDVGSGKTIVSIWALVICVQNGYQAALMAPTEILARQHLKNISSLLEPLGIRLLP